MFKENKDGQTNFCNHLHDSRASMCDKCLGKENKDSQKEDKWDWEKEYERLCSESYAKGGFLTTDLHKNWELDALTIKDFISKVESNTIERCAEVVKMLQNTKTNLDDNEWNIRNEGFNRALDTVVDEILKLNK